MITDRYFFVRGGRGEEKSSKLDNLNMKSYASPTPTIITLIFLITTPFICNAFSNMKTSVYIATTLDGFIAASDGSISFLDEFQQNVAPEDGDMGFSEFLSTVDLLVMGRKTWDQVVSFGDDMWPYGERIIWVWSRSPEKVVIPNCRKDQAFAYDLLPSDIIDLAKEKGLSHLYIDGGSTIQGFQRAGLIDDYILSRMPVLLGGGIPLFDNNDAGALQKLEHLETKCFSNGIVQSHYRVKR